MHVFGRNKLIFHFPFHFFPLFLGIAKQPNTLLFENNWPEANFSKQIWESSRLHAALADLGALTNLLAKASKIGSSFAWIFQILNFAFASFLFYLHREKATCWFLPWFPVWMVSVFEAQILQGLKCTRKTKMKTYTKSRRFKLETHLA